MDALSYFSGTQLNWPMVSAVFVLAGIVKGVVGLGLPTVAIGLLALAMPPADAAALLILPSLFTNVWQASPRTLWPVLKRLAPMQVGIVLGTIGGAWLFGAPAGAWSSVLLGVALIVYALCQACGAHGPRVEWRRLHHQMSCINIMVAWCGSPPTLRLSARTAQHRPT